MVRGGTAPRLPLNDGSGVAGVTSVTPPGASAFRTVTMRAGFLPDPWVLPDGNGAGVTGIVAQSGLEGGCSRAHSGFVLGGVSVGPRVGSASGTPGDLLELVSPQASPDPAESSNDESIDASSSHPSRTCSVRSTSSTLRSLKAACSRLPSSASPTRWTSSNPSICSVHHALYRARPLQRGGAHRVHGVRCVRHHPHARQAVAAWDVCGVVFKAIKDRLAVSRQLRRWASGGTQRR